MAFLYKVDGSLHVAGRHNPSLLQVAGCKNRQHLNMQVFIEDERVRDVGIHGFVRRLVFEDF